MHRVHCIRALYGVELAVSCAFANPEGKILAIEQIFLD